MTDPQDTQWLDEIISQLTVNTGEEYMKLHTGEKSFDASNSYMTYYENQAKQAILAHEAEAVAAGRIDTLERLQLRGHTAKRASVPNINNPAFDRPDWISIQTPIFYCFASTIPDMIKQLQRGQEGK